MGTTPRPFLTAETGTLIFAFVNLIITKILFVITISALTHIAIIGWLQPNMSKSFAYPYSLNHVAAAVLLIVYFFVAEIVAALFLLGVFRKRPLWIYVYLVHGVAIVIFTLTFSFMLLCGIVEMSELRNKTFAAVTFIVGGVYLLILVMVRRVYKKFKNEQAVKTKASSLKV